MSLPVDDPHNITAVVFGADPVPVDLAALAADLEYGDGVYAGPAFAAWQYVLLGDGSQAAYDGVVLVWFDGAMPPSMPLSGEVIADLATLRALLGAVSVSDDANLSRALATATEHIFERVMRCDWAHVDVQYAILLLSARLYQRRKSPEGVAGFGNEGVVVRVLANDPDIARLIERHADMATAGIG